MERLYDMKEALKLIGVHIRTIQKWDKEGEIRCVRTVGGKRRVPESEIKRILGIYEERRIIGYTRVSSPQKDDLEDDPQVEDACEDSGRGCHERG